MAYLKGIIITLALFILHVQSIMWYMDPNSKKCLREELQAHVDLSGEYEVSEVPGQTVDFEIRDSKGHILAHNENIQHGKPVKFKSIMETYDTVEICFTSHAPPNHRGMKQEISLVVKKGIEAKNFEGIAEVAKLKPIEVELKKLEYLSEAIVQDFARMRKNEEEMRDTNEATNSRVLYFSIFSILCLLGLAVWQVFYLRRFFRAKKLIE